MTTDLRTVLFVPASRLDWMHSALASEADAIVVDFEDGVAPEAKRAARSHLEQFCTKWPEVHVLVRVNGVGTRWFADDLAMCSRLVQVDGIMLPKVSSADDVERAAASGKPIFPIIESARAIVALAQIVIVPGVQRLAMGSLDLAVDFSMQADSEGGAVILDFIRYQVLLHSRASGLAAPLDGVYPDIHDSKGLTLVAAKTGNMGFAGMLCIHPSQVAIIHAALAPTSDEVAWARRLVEAARSCSGVFRLDGKMIDAPVVARAKQILERSRL